MKQPSRKNSFHRAPNVPAATWDNIVPSRTMQRELKREALLRAAMAAFHRQGFHETSLDEIAQRLGVTRAALYYYFQSKNDLLVACFERAMQLARDSLAKAKRDGAHGREKLILFFKRYLAIATDELGESLLLTEEQALEAEDRLKLIEERDRLERELRALVKEGIKDGSIVPCDPKLTIFLMLGAVNWVPKWFSRKGSWTNLQVAQAAAEMLDRMLSTAPPPKVTDDVRKARVEP